MGKNQNSLPKECNNNEKGPPNCVPEKITTLNQNTKGEEQNCPKEQENKAADPLDRYQNPLGREPYSSVIAIPIPQYHNPNTASIRGWIDVECFLLEKRLKRPRNRRVRFGSDTSFSDLFEGRYPLLEHEVPNYEKVEPSVHEPVLDEIENIPKEKKINNGLFWNVASFFKGLFCWCIAQADQVPNSKYPNKLELDIHIEVGKETLHKCYFCRIISYAPKLVSRVLLYVIFY